MPAKFEKTRVSRSVIFIDIRVSTYLYALFTAIGVILAWVLSAQPPQPGGGLGQLDDDRAPEKHEVAAGKLQDPTPKK